MLTLKKRMQPIQVLHLRFFALPQSFFFLETLQMSSAKKCIFFLKSEHLFNANLIQGATLPLPPQLLPQSKQLLTQSAYYSGDDSDGPAKMVPSETLKVPELFKAKTDPEKEPKEKTIDNSQTLYVKNKFKLSQLQSTENAFDIYQRVDQSISEVPTDCI